jgi:hypothetical protein
MYHVFLVDSTPALSPLAAAAFCARTPVAPSGALARVLTPTLWRHVMPQHPGHERPPPDRRYATAPVPRRREPRQNFLRDRAQAARLVALAQLTPDDLAVDLGAGHGAIAAPLAAAAGRVLAVESHPARARVLGRRFADDERVHVVEGRRPA